MTVFDTIELKKVSKDDIDFLYELLKERDASITITQKKLPSLKEHRTFVENQLMSINGDRENIEKARLDPYDGWYIITSDAIELGSVWIEKDGNIGLQIQKKFQKIGIGVIAYEKIQKIHKKENYKTTINPNNNEAIKLTEKLGFILKEKAYDQNIYVKS